MSAADKVKLEAGWKQALHDEFDKPYICLLYTSPSPRDS